VHRRDVEWIDPPGAFIMSRRSWEPARVGVLLLDDQLRLVHHSAEAANILLGHPKAPADKLPLDAVLPATRSQIGGGRGSGSSTPIEFTSGRRRYSCCAFRLESQSHPTSPFQPSIVVVLERVVRRPVDVAQWSQEFQLTARECEAVTLLLQGLSGKQIAAAMRVSPSTVKTFLKLAMAKVGVSTRAGIIAKVLGRVS
jgi:DNA-binding CsgD family transcriptional regulator